MRLWLFIYLWYYWTWKNIKNVLLFDNDSKEEIQSNFDNKTSTLSTKLDPNKDYNLMFKFEVNDDTFSPTFKVSYKTHTKKLLNPEVTDIKVNLDEDSPEDSFNVTTSFENSNNIEKAKVCILNKEGKVISEKEVDNEEFNKPEEGDSEVTTFFNEEDGIKQGTMYYVKVLLEEKSFSESPSKHQYFSDEFWTNNKSVEVKNLVASLDDSGEINISFGLTNYLNAKKIQFEVVNKDGETILNYATNDIQSPNISKTLFVDERYELSNLTLRTSVWELKPDAHINLYLEDNWMQIEGIEEIIF